jgi:hypothetical protein
MLSDFPVQLFTVSNCTAILKEEKVVEILVDKLNSVLSKAATIKDEQLKEPLLSIDPEEDLIFDRGYYR